MKFIHSHDNKLRSIIKSVTQLVTVFLRKLNISFWTVSAKLQQQREVQQHQVVVRHCDIPLQQPRGWWRLRPTITIKLPAAAVSVSQPPRLKRCQVQATTLAHHPLRLQLQRPPPPRLRLGLVVYNLLCGCTWRLQPQRLVKIINILLFQIFL